MSPRQTDGPAPGVVWVRASEVKVGDRVPMKIGAQPVTHSQHCTEAPQWMLRFPYGVRYYEPDAPVAVEV